MTARERVGRAVTLGHLMAQARRLSDGPAVTLIFTPGWCLASVAVRVPGWNGRLRRTNWGRGAKSPETAVRRLIRALKGQERS